MGHKSHVKQIVKGKKQLLDPIITPEDYNHWQVVRIKIKLQSMIEGNQLILSENSLFDEQEIFNPRRHPGNIAVFVHFKFR